jgi:hypothetical protein
VTPIQLIIAILITFLVIPGGGHVYLKHKARGFAITGAVIVWLVVFFGYVVSTMMTQVRSLGGKVNSQHIEKMAEAFSQDLFSLSTLPMQCLIFALGVIYILSLADLILIYLDER